MDVLSPVLEQPVPSRSRQVLNSCFRYGLTSLGPVAVSGAHFLASLLFLRLMKPADFGHFSFVLIIVPFCLSMTGAMLAAPASMTRGKDAKTARAELRTLAKAAVAVSSIAGVAVSLMMLLTGAPAAILFGLYGAAYTLRTFARCRSNVLAHIEQVAGSDIVYAAALSLGLLALAALKVFSLSSVALMLVLATLLAFLPFGRVFATEMVVAFRTAPFKAYRPMWRDVSRWSLFGVVLTEVASNCHAYLVTFISGPGAFGLLALGALFMRPASLVLGALPDVDQPLMTRKVVAGDISGAFRVVNEFRTAAGAVLAGTVLLALILVFWFPHLLLKHYAVPDVLVVLAFWSAITLLRVVRTPEAVFLMATGGYPKLAWISGVSGIVALAITLGLLVTFGPLVSLGGVLAGEVVMVAMLFPLTNVWRRQRA